MNDEIFNETPAAKRYVVGFAFNEDSEYISPGGLGEFLQQANATWHYSRADIYHYAAKFLLAFGKVHWERRIKDVKS